MKKVKFSNGKFGILKHNFWFLPLMFIDLKTLMWWTPGSKYFKDCQGTEEEVDEVLSRIRVTYEVVD